MTELSDALSAALAPLVAAALPADGALLLPTQAAQYHRRIIFTWASVLGVSWNPVTVKADDAASSMQVDGGFAGSGLHDDVRFIVEPAASQQPGRSQQELAVWLAQLYLPDRGQGQGAATVLLRAPKQLWMAMGVAEAHAYATGAGSVATARWRFWLGSNRSGGPLSTVTQLREAAALDGDNAVLPAPEHLQGQLDSLLDLQQPERVQLAALLTLQGDADGYGRQLLLQAKWAAWAPLSRAFGQ